MGGRIMKTYSYSEVERNLSTILNTALTQDVIIRKRDGRKFRIIPVTENTSQSPFEVPGINTGISTKDIVDILKQSRARI